MSGIVLPTVKPMRRSHAAFGRLTVLGLVAAVVVCIGSFLGVAFAAILRPSRTTHRRTSMSAVVVTKRKKGAGAETEVINPKLRSLVSAAEFRQMLDFCKKLEKQGNLDEFLQKAEDYWQGVNIFQLAMEEQKGGGRAVLRQIRKDWSRIWPEKLDEDRMIAFDTFSTFWKRLEASRLIDTVMKEVLPDMAEGYKKKSESGDQEMFLEMTPDQRRDEILGRLTTSQTVAQFMILTKDDPDLKQLGSKLAPFVAKSVAILERKVSTQVESLGQVVDYGFFFVLALAVFGILAGFGYIKLPSFMTDEIVVPSAAPAATQVVLPGASPAPAPDAILSGIDKF